LEESGCTHDRHGRPRHGRHSSGAGADTLGQFLIVFVSRFRQLLFIERVDGWVYGKFLLRQQTTSQYTLLIILQRSFLFVWLLLGLLVRFAHESQRFLLGREQFLGLNGIDGFDGIARNQRWDCRWRRIGWYRWRCCRRRRSALSSTLMSLICCATAPRIKLRRPCLQRSAGGPGETAAIR